MATGDIIGVEIDDSAVLVRAMVEGWTLARLGEALGVSRERARQRINMFRTACGAQGRPAVRRRKRHDRGVPRSYTRAIKAAARGMS